VNSVLFETDWLASQPVFYNERTGKASHNINDVIDYANLEFDREGFNNYLDFGYSVLEQTPINHVRFLRHSSRLLVDERGKLSVEYLSDPLEQWRGYRLSEDDVIDLIKHRVSEWERSVEGEIIIPTSGGYDSRLLNWCIEDKSRVRSFTYGISDHQAESYEVVYAQRLSAILGTRWEQIPLGDFHKYFDDWEKLFGVSTHAHGMYHFEFYDNILARLEGGNPFLSGITGDSFAGNWDISKLDGPADVRSLGFTRGVHADSGYSQYLVQGSRLTNYWDTQKERLQDKRVCVIEAMRFKIILLCYLVIVPRAFRFRPWSPFLDLDVAMAMINLPTERRRDRIWQREFFEKCGLGFESMDLKASRQNTLDLQAVRRVPVKPLDVTLLREVVQPDYVAWINRNVRYGWREKMLEGLFHSDKVEGVLKRLGVSSNVSRQREAYNAYCVLLPIENLLRKRNLT
jgi:hypothetical protein